MSPHIDEPDPRLIAKWAERYARSRTLPFLVQWFFIVCLVIAITLLSQGALMAYWWRKPILQWICMVAIGVLTIGLMWFSVSQWGQEQIWRISQWLYSKEGYATYSGPKPDRARRLRLIPAIGIGLAVYLLAGAVLVGLGYLPIKYLQPYSALFMLPFLAILIVTQRLGSWAWIWPVLYGAHAVLILGGFPLNFRGRWLFLDIIVPVFGYGLISMLAGHIYSRYALRRLKRLARTGLKDRGDEQDNGRE
jgi:hypothetical protein